MKLASTLTFAATLALGLLNGCTRHQPPATSDLINTDATLHGQLPYPILSWTPLVVTVDRTMGTTSTLFTDGTSRALVTWSQREDPHWFGARIPGAPQRVELVDPTNGTHQYRVFSGSPLTEQTVSGDPTERIVAIAAMQQIELP
ncbi:hypothetical protein SAMN05421819_3743 [Bryocella elongata]|uniref:Uncharacterized protein n=1 Tax=Bryocella elongata TaxID=863522 RepID=A0A1H6BJ57_9BACT|nr:hypothetical protein [Bryocella elongata]SEG60662.1 hypothetical protein SAMN05421819_3743 [Bryocella elongata]